MSSLGEVFVNGLTGIDVFHFKNHCITLGIRLLYVYSEFEIVVFRPSRLIHPARQNQ